MPAWMEKIKDTFTAKADLKSLFIVLQPDNQVSTVMVVSYVPTDKDSFQVFMDLTARIAMDQKTIPDNLLLHLREYLLKIFLSPANYRRKTVRKPSVSSPLTEASLKTTPYLYGKRLI